MRVQPDAVRASRLHIEALVAGGDAGVADDGGHSVYETTPLAAGCG